MIITITINWTTNCTHVDNDNVVADNNVCSHVWGVSGGSYAIGLSNGGVVQANVGQKVMFLTPP
jgi:hypothetical protein